VPGTPPRSVCPVEDSARARGAGNTEEYIPYWLQLWPSALVLADELAAGRVAVDGARVAEISAGLGLPGVTAGPLLPPPLVLIGHAASFTPY